MGAFQVLLFTPLRRNAIIMKGALTCALPRNRTLSPSKDFSSNLKGQSKTRSTEPGQYIVILFLLQGQYCALPSVEVRNYPQNLSQNNWRTLKLAPFMRFPLLSVTHHHYHLIQSMSISQYGLHLYQAHRCQTKLCQTGCCFTRFLSSTSSLSCSMLCKPCNVCNRGSPLGNHLSVDEGKKVSKLIF